MVSRSSFWDVLTFSDVTRSFCTEEQIVLRVLKDDFGQVLLLLKLVRWWLVTQGKLSIFI